MPQDRSYKPNIGLITSPFVLKAGIAPLFHLIAIFSSLTEKVFVCTGSEGATATAQHPRNTEVFLVEKQHESRALLKLLKYIRANLKVSYKIIVLRKKVNIWAFFLGERPLWIPMAVARLIGKKTIFISSGSLLKVPQEQSKNPINREFVNLSRNLNHQLANEIVVYSKRLVSREDLIKYDSKICISSEHFLNFKDFCIKKYYNKRPFQIGFIGRLSEEKGILNFVDAIPDIQANNDNLKIIIGGDGPLREQVVSLTTNNLIKANLKFAGWIEYSALPDYLNDLRLLVLPSYSEGLPNIILEAMACGTPILATPVGAIPDIIKDGENGFLMRDNSPECISGNVNRIVNYPEIYSIIDNALYFVNKEFSFDRAVERYKNILDKL